MTYSYTDEGSRDELFTRNIATRTKCSGHHQHYGTDNNLTNNLYYDVNQGDRPSPGRSEIIMRDCDAAIRASTHSRPTAVTRRQHPTPPTVAAASQTSQERQTATTESAHPSRSRAMLCCNLQATTAHSLQRPLRTVLTTSRSNTTTGTRSAIHRGRPCSSILGGTVVRGRATLLSGRRRGEMRARYTLTHN